ncbi:hypothetical protein [Kitasatospora sp. NPDC059327]|uniref:hypothetical protein n=1 Tax=Kitasatospora sp. NPDC059327 TaxID=3346803 RepID=UPI003686A741
MSDQYPADHRRRRRVFARTHRRAGPPGERPPRPPRHDVHGCRSTGEDTPWGGDRRRTGSPDTLAALRPIRAARPDGAPST